MKKELLIRARRLDRAMLNGNARMLKLDKKDQGEINRTLHYNLGLIRDAVVAMIISYDKSDAKKKNYKKEYHTFMKSWNNFTKNSLSPKEAGERLEKVRQANLKLIKQLESSTTKDHLKIID